MNPSSEDKTTASQLNDDLLRTVVQCTGKVDIAVLIERDAVLCLLRPALQHCPALNTEVFIGERMNVGNPDSGKGEGTQCQHTQNPYRNAQLRQSEPAILPMPVHWIP